MTRKKELDEVFCRSCGEPIKKKAEICPECGVRREGGHPPGTSSTQPHDSSKYETTVSNSWYFGVILGTVGWAVFIIISSIAPGSEENTLVALVLISAWVILPISVYFDIQYVRANSKWDPETGLWIIGGVVPLVNIVIAAVYLYRRHEVLGEP
jgi:hypothetical protein